MRALNMFPAVAAAAAMMFSVLAHARAGEPEWVPTGGPFGGEIRRSDAGAMTAAIATDLGLYVSADGARTWRGPWRPIAGQAARFRELEVGDPHVFAVLQSGALWRSSDHGASWSQPTSPGPIQSLEWNEGRLWAVVISPSNPQEVIIRVSADLGETWTTVNRPGPLISGELFVEGDTLWAVVPDLVQFGFGPSTGYRSTDGGQSWQLMSGGLESAGGMNQAVIPQVRAGSRLWSGLWYSDDEGQSWTQLSVEEDLGVFGWSLWEPAFHIINGVPHVMGYLTGHNLEPPREGVDGYYLWRTTDLDNWEVVTSSLQGNWSFPWHIMRLAGKAHVLDGDIVFLGGFGAIRSSDGGITWRTSMTNVDSELVWTMASCDRGLAAVPANSSRVWSLAGPGEPWRYGSIFDNGDLVGTVLTLFSPGGDTLFAGHLYDGITKSTDGGITWSFANTGVPQYNGTAGLQYAEIGDFCTKGPFLFAVSTLGLETPANSSSGAPIFRGSGVIRSADNGASWQRVNSGLPIIAQNNFGEPMFDPLFSIAAVEDTLIVGGAFLGVFRSSNDGASWTAANTGLPAERPIFNDLLTVGTRVYAAADFTEGGEGVWSTDDRGLTWQRRSTGLPPQHGAMTLALHRGELYVGLASQLNSIPFQFTDRGVFKSSDGGATWTRVGTALTGISVRALVERNGILYAATEGAGVWRLTTPCAADINSSGAATVQDIYDFLELWLLSNPRADFNSAGGITVQDIYDYFEAWLAGCN